MKISPVQNLLMHRRHLYGHDAVYFNVLMEEGTLNIITDWPSTSIKH